MKQLFTFFLSLTILSGFFQSTVFAAPDWPADVSIEAEGGIVMDAHSGAVLYGKNIHSTYFPASITKILTALIVIENCPDLEEIVTYSQNAVYNVEVGSTNANLETGDQLTILDSLYALLIRSANEAGNALAEHVAGTTEEFAVMMNQKATELGCTNTNFENPSGLNNPNHYTSAYDMALIAKAAFSNETFRMIDSTLRYRLPVTKRTKEGEDGLAMLMGHKMMNPNSSNYYPGIIGGKTGYTSLAGNTLVTYAEQDGMTLIAVILNGHLTHYTDTKALLDFGFKNFTSLSAAQHDQTYARVGTDLSIAGVSLAAMPPLLLSEDGFVTLPKTAHFTDAVSTLTYDLPANAPSDAVSMVSYKYGDRNVGNVYLIPNQTVTEILPTDPILLSSLEDTTSLTESTEQEGASSPVAPAIPHLKPFKIPSVVWTVLLVVLVLGAIIGGSIALKIRADQKAENERRQRQERRRMRLQESGYSSSEFEQLLEQRRSTYTTTRRGRGRKR